MNRLKCYYAHSLHLYNTSQEERDVLLLESLNFKVINPNAQRHFEAYKKEGMDYFANLVKSCDVLAFRAYPNGKIPAGVHFEATFAINNDMPVFEIPWGFNRRGLSVEETREWLHELGQR
jgi:hypothetical protein